jgi:hypothetical protein
MAVIQTRFFRILLGPTLLISCLLVSAESYRATASVIFLTIIACYIHFLVTLKTKLLRLTFVAFLIAAFLPIDISLQNYPGPPRFVPLIMGAPGEPDVAQADRGEVMLGGCIMHGNEPKWVWVW